MPEVRERAMVNRTQIYIVEGPDGAGKSTLVGSQIFMGEQKDHVGQPKTNDPFTEYMALIRSRCEGPLQRKVAVFDRLHLGEHVYGPIFRGADRLGFPASRMIDRYLLQNPVVVIVCLPPLYQIKENVCLTDGTQLPRTTEHLEAIYRGYSELRYNLPVVVHDYTIGGDAPYRTMKRCMKIMGAQVNGGVGIGSWMPDNNIVVSTSHHIDPKRRVDVSLAAGLHEGGVLEKNLYWMTVEQMRRDPMAPMRMAAHRVLCIGAAAAASVGEARRQWPKDFYHPGSFALPDLTEQNAFSVGRDVATFTVKTETQGVGP